MGCQEIRTMAAADPADIAACVAVATARSFRRAAAQRGVSPSALSEAVRRLEAAMGVRQFNRTTRSVTPTEAGQRLIDRAGPALDALAEAVADAGGGGGRLRLNVPGAADMFLPDLLARFMAAHPAVAVEAVADNTFAHVLAAGFDAGIRYGESLDQDMMAIPIGPRRQRMVVAAAPAYWDGAGRPEHPDELSAHRLIRDRFASGAMAVWEFRKGDVVRRLPGPAALVTTTSAMQIAAAEAGAGVVCTFDGFLAASLASGRLEEVLEDWSDPFEGPYLYFPSRRLMPQGLRRFVDFLHADRDRRSD
jgi:DNA-binding transcriptional LysR family regulator